MANPRIDELRRRIEREPGSRLFSQLAEELRKEGDLTEAIRVARAGLAAHPNYPSARLTLGRALFDTGQFGPARIELEAFSGERPTTSWPPASSPSAWRARRSGAALLQYRAAQRLSPGDKQIEAQVRSIEQRWPQGQRPGELPPAGQHSVTPGGPRGPGPTGFGPPASSGAHLG